MKKIFVLSFCLFFIFGAEAQMPAKEKFQPIYEQAVQKMLASGSDTVKFHVFRAEEWSIGSLAYEKKHDCLCNDEQCHGPRLTLTTLSGKTKITIFPNGDYFSETNNFSPGITIVKINPEKEKKAEARFIEEAEKVLSDFVTL